MTIAVLGGGAMGSLFGGYLSRKNDVTIVDVNNALVEKINAEGVCIEEKDGTTQLLFPNAVVSTEGMAPVDLVIVFVKAMYSASALQNNKGIIGPDTFVMTLQNGSGHEQTLLTVADEAHVIIGTTQHNSTAKGLGHVCHGGSGTTYLGSLKGELAPLEPIAQSFTSCGLETSTSGEVRKMIWSKMFTNVSASVLTAALECPLGFISDNKHAWNMCKTLIQEAVDVANGTGLDFNEQQQIEAVRGVCERARNGYTSIYADLKAGRRSEVDTISGSVVRAGEQIGVPTPSHSFIVEMIHAMEDAHMRKGE